MVLRGDLERLGARGLAGPLPAVPLRQDVPVRRPQGVRRGHATAKAGRTTASRWCIDEGFHADDPRYRLAQIQDALLRDARFIVGIRMHTKGMTMEQAEDFFVDGRLPAAPGRAVREQARHVGPDLRLLHDGQADDPQAARRLQGEDGRAVLAAVVPRHVHPPRTAAAAARPQGDARRSPASCSELVRHHNRGRPAASYHVHDTAPPRIPRPTTGATSGLGDAGLAHRVFAGC